MTSQAPLGDDETIVVRVTCVVQLLDTAQHKPLVADNVYLATIQPEDTCREPIFLNQRVPTELHRLRTSRLMKPPLGNQHASSTT